MMTLHVIGNLGKDAEVKDTRKEVNGKQAGGRYLYWTMASNSKRGDKEVTQWINCWYRIGDRDAEKILSWLKKGMHVYCYGEPNYSVWKDNVNVTLNVERFEMILNAREKSDTEYKVKHDADADLQEKAKDMVQTLNQGLGLEPQEEGDLPF